MKINAVYACHFNIGENSGKSRATRQKLYYLSKTLTSLKIISGISGPKILRVLVLLRLEGFRVIILLLTENLIFILVEGILG